MCEWGRLINLSGRNLNEFGKNFLRHKNHPGKNWDFWEEYLPLDLADRWAGLILDLIYIDLFAYEYV